MLVAKRSGKRLTSHSTPSAVRGLNKTVRDLAHGVQVVLGILNVLDGLSIVRLDTSLEESLEGLVVFVPLVDLGVGDNLRLLGSGRLRRRLVRLPGAGLLLSGLLLLRVALSLAAPARCGDSSGWGRSWLDGDAAVVVHPLHVIPQVPLARETVAGNGALATLIGAEVRLLTMAVHRVGLTLMPEEASSGGKPSVLATLNTAAVGLEVGIHKLAVERG